MLNATSGLVHECQFFCDKAVFPIPKIWDVMNDLLQLRWGEFAGVPRRFSNPKGVIVSKKCFFSFHYKKDVWRVSQVRQIGVIEKQPLLKSNEWEEVKKKGDDNVKDWISKNMKGKECLVVLVGEETAGRRWVKYEIKKAWKDGLGVVAICIHNLKDAGENQSNKGLNPFEGLVVEGKPVIGGFYDPPYKTSKYVYEHIAENIEDWVKDAVNARSS